jgi:uncharacterized protein (TIGR02391 family)
LSLATTLRHIGGDVKIVRLGGPKGPRRLTALAVIQYRRAIFLIDTPIAPGDLIEHPIQPGVTRVYEVTRVVVQRGYEDMQHIEAHFKIAGAPDPVIAQPLRLPWLHPLISAAAAALFEDGYTTRAGFAAFQAVEHRVQELTGRSDSGKKLMMAVFDGASPTLDVARYIGRSGQDEREGFKFIFAGAFLALRNPRGHGADRLDDPTEAMEYLALASLLMRRLDDAEQAMSA